MLQLLFKHPNFGHFHTAKAITLTNQNTNHVHTSTFSRYSFAPALQTEVMHTRYVFSVHSLHGPIKSDSSTATPFSHHELQLFHQQEHLAALHTAITAFRFLLLPFPALCSLQCRKKATQNCSLTATKNHSTQSSANLLHSYYYLLFILRITEVSVILVEK